MTSTLAQLKDQFRRLQGSVNYWNNAARAARKDADKHAHQPARQQHDLARLANCEHKATEASQQLDGIKAQLTELDPQGARHRQIRSLHSAIARAKREISHFEHLAQLPGQSESTQAHTRQRLATKRAKLEQLLEGLAKHHDQAEQEASRQRNQHECVAAASRALSYDLDAEIRRENARHGLSAAAAAAPQDLAAIEALRKGIEHALRAGDQLTAERLAAALAWQLDADPPTSARSTH